MTVKTIASLILATSVAAGSATSAAADTAGGFIAGAIIGGLLVNEANKSKRQTTNRAPARSTKSTQPTGQREVNRETQVALNYFAYPVGTPDGALGPRSRAAIAEYQASLGYPATGQLTPFERDVLVGAYHRAQAGGAATLQEIARNPRGVRGLLLIHRDQMLGGPGMVMAGAAQAGGAGFGGGSGLSGAFGGLPREVAASVEEIARNANVQADQLVQRSGFIQLADINRDGRTDYLLDTSVTGSGFWCSAQACAVRVFASTPEGYQRNDFQVFDPTPAMFDCNRGTCNLTSGGTMAAQPQGLTQSVPPTAAALPALPVPAPVPAPAPALPSFLGGGLAAVSVAAHCDRISLLTNTNGGFVTVATMTDPAFALSEQFCLARGQAMTQSDALVARIPGFTPQQIAQQCEGFGPVLKDHVAALAREDRDTRMQALAGFVRSTGMATDQLVGTARICLGVGYRLDDMDVAVGSAMILAALGETGYAELAAHHLAQGFGTAARPDLAIGWYELSLDSGSALFAPAMDGRAALIRKAALTLGGRPERAEAPAAIPVFTLPAPVPTPVPTPVPAAPAVPAAGSGVLAAVPGDAAVPVPVRQGLDALPLAARLPFLVFSR